MANAKLIHGDCVEVLPTLPSASADCVITDPPYPCIKRSYGFWTEEEWFAMMRAVVPECMRLLKPKGSAVFVLQPNSERVGRMRTWLWEFLVWVGKEYGIVQDAYWWNTSAIPEAHSIQGRLMRPSLKACIWIGPPDCYRDQGAVLWSESEQNVRDRVVSRCGREARPGGHGTDRYRMAHKAVGRGGVLPFNVLPFGGGKAAGVLGHGAGTPLKLCSWWARYLCQPGGTILDPFCGSGTVGVAAIQHGADFIGIERIAEYVTISEKRLAEAGAKT